MRGRRKTLSRGDYRVRPTTPDGNLYYVRLKTPHGVFYKLGFTKQPSVEARFSYNGSLDYRFIDKVLLFKAMLDAYDVEIMLHTYFADDALSPLGRPDPALPLANNGQSEVYYRDVLGIDPERFPSSRKTFWQELHSSLLELKENPLKIPEALVIGAFSLWGAAVLGPVFLIYIFGESVKERYFPSDNDRVRAAQIKELEAKRKALLARVIAEPHVDTHAEHQKATRI